MKLCKQCNAEQADEARFCNLCGAPLEDAGETVEETAAEETSVEEVSEETAEETAEGAVEEAVEVTEDGEAVEDVTVPAEEPVMAEKKKTPWGWIIGLAAAVVLIVALILVKGNAGSAKGVDLDAALHTNAHGFESYSIHFEADEEGKNTYSYMNEAAETVTVDEDSVAALMDQVIASTGIVELNNRDLQYYYDQQYYYFYNMYSSYLSYLMDTTKGLDEQQDMYGGGTWQNYFLNASVDMFHQVAALYQIATEEGFLLTEEQQAELDASLDLAATAANYGYEDVDQFMKDYFGPFATVESYQNFIRMNMTASYYASGLADALVLEPADVEAYYDTNEAVIQANYGIEKIDKNVVNVRHILIQPAAAEDGTISDDAWAAAEVQANEIYEQWKAGAADEAFFAELATANTQDPGSQATGGLYEDVYPGQMVPEFNDWCFADDRQVGDHGVVKTSYGYHIMFFSGEGDYVYWRMAAEDMLRMERAAEERASLVESYTLERDLTKAVLLDTTAPTAPAAEEPAEGETAE